MNILLTVAHFNGWHGSVIQVIEYAEMLSKENHVAIVCLDYVSKLKVLLNKINVDVFCITDENIPLEYDLVYSFHYPLFSYLLQKGISTKKWVAGSLSPTTGIESFPSYWSKANFLTVHSGRSIELHEMHYGIPPEKMKLFGNPIPAEFSDFVHHKEGFPKTPQNIVVISNHIPHEILEIKKLLHKNSRVDFYGHNSKNYDRITAKILSAYDLIISIGKTVQYALGMGIPVYEYDIYGGCGYITPSNYDSEKFRNFCGLATERKLNSKAIVSEILQEYELAVQNISVIKQKALEDFYLPKLMDHFLELVNDSEEINLCKEKLSDYSLEIVHDIETVNVLISNNNLHIAIKKKFVNRVIDFIRKKIINWK